MQNILKYNCNSLKHTVMSPHCLFHHLKMLWRWYTAELVLSKFVIKIVQSPKQLMAENWRNRTETRQLLMIS